MALNDDLEWKTKRKSTPLAIGIQTAELQSFRGVEKNGGLLVLLSLQSLPGNCQKDDNNNTVIERVKTIDNIEQSKPAQDYS